MLLSAGCQPDVISGTRSAPLHLAVQRGFLEVVRVLCEHGCDVNLPVSAVPLPQSWDRWPSSPTPSDHDPLLAGRPCGHAPALCHLGGRWCQWHRGGPHRGAHHRRHGHQ